MTIGARDIAAIIATAWNRLMRYDSADGVAEFLDIYRQRSAGDVPEGVEFTSPQRHETIATGQPARQSRPTASNAPGIAVNSATLVT